MPGRMFLLALAAMWFTAPPAEAQILDRLRRTIADAKSTLDDARSLRCEAQGVCGEVWASDLFAPEAYESMAVAVFDATRRFRSPDMQALVRDAFEGGLIEGGYLLAASTDASQVQERIGAGREEWSDERLAQLRDFISGIDAVLVVDIRSLELGRCTVKRNNRDVGAQRVTVGLSARWLNVDVGDIPWVALHEATVCEDGGRQAMSAALETVARQLATNLPKRSPP